MKPVEAIDSALPTLPADDAALGDGVPDGARLVLRLPPPVPSAGPNAGRSVGPTAAASTPASPGASAAASAPAGAGVIVPYPDLTVRLAERGFVIEDIVAQGAEWQLRARKTAIAVRGYRDGDEQAIRELFYRSFHHELSPARWRWRYLDHPLGGRRISVAWTADGTLLGHYGGYPMVFQHAGQLLRAHQNGDVMTDPRARRLGRGDASIVRRLAQHFWAAYGEGRVDFHYGFNSGTARALQTRVVPGVRVLEDVGLWACDDLAIAATRDPRVQVERISCFDAEWDDFARRMHAQDSGYGLVSRRDAAYMNWRYLDRPDSDDVALVARAHDRIVGGAVFQCRPDETRWGDALFDPRPPAGLTPTDIAAAVLAAIVAAGATRRTTGWFPARPAWWVQVLTQLGFRQEPEPHGLSLVYVPFTPEAERLLPTLYYTWGDSDLF